MVDNGYNIGDPEFNLEEVLLSTAWNYTGQKSKNIAYFNDFVSVEVGGYDVDLYAGGIAGKSNGLIKRYVSENYKMYGYAGYSAYTKISVSNSAKHVYLGGVVGAVESSILDDGTKTSENYIVSNVLYNLLVGGEISANIISVSANGAGVFVGENAYFSMTGGIIQNNQAGGRGGGIFIHE